MDLFVYTDTQLQKILTTFDDFVQKNLILRNMYFANKADMTSFQVEGYEVQLFIES
ncbi:hypothetical protein [Gracilibacillus phocaeensis]|uniref:hypothetical protein n=1 Tax=Gracilibacillus phocaeensis TaxID=2042304 RepID=UPI0033071FFB